jgi:hypothetical protein
LALLPSQEQGAEFRVYIATQGQTLIERK